MDYVSEPIPQEPVDQEDDESGEPDLADFEGVRRGGIAPSLAAAMEKWDGMFKRNSPQIAWKVQFKTTRRSSHGDHNLPEGFPKLDEFFAKCKNMEVIDWVLDIHRKLRENYQENGMWVHDDNSFYALAKFMRAEAEAHGARKMQVKNPAYVPPDEAKKYKGPATPSAMRQRPGLMPKRNVAARVHDPSVPEYIEKTFFMTKFQRSLIRKMIHEEGWFMEDNAVYPLPIVRERVRIRLLKACKAIGKISLWYKMSKAALSKKRSRQENPVAEQRNQGSPSLKQRVD